MPKTGKENESLKWIQCEQDVVRSFSSNNSGKHIMVWFSLVYFRVQVFGGPSASFQQNGCRVYVQTNGTSLDEGSWLAWTSWAEGSASVLYDAMTMLILYYSCKPVPVANLFSVTLKLFLHRTFIQLALEGMCEGNVFANSSSSSTKHTKSNQSHLPKRPRELKLKCRTPITQCTWRYHPGIFT